MKKIELDGNNFSTLTGFYEEVESKLTNNIDWTIGRNLDAFNDLLRGGFGVHEYGEPISWSWINADKSEAELGMAATINYIENKLETCHPANKEFVLKDLEKAKAGQGETLFQLLVGIIKTHDHIDFTRD